MSSGNAVLILRREWARAAKRGGALSGLESGARAIRLPGRDRTWGLGKNRHPPQRSRWAARGRRGGVVVGGARARTGGNADGCGRGRRKPGTRGGCGPTRLFGSAEAKFEGGGGAKRGPPAPHRPSSSSIWNKAASRLFLRPPPADAISIPAVCAALSDVLRRRRRATLLDGPLKPSA